MTQDTPNSPTARALAGVIAICAFAALAVQTTVNDGTVLENLGGMVRFFTIWGNIAACVVMGGVALGWKAPRGVMASLATALTVIGLVYWLLLASIHHPEGIDRITNQFHHTLVPMGFAVWWLAFTPPSPKALALTPAIMVPPLSYGAFAFVYGHFTGFYAYFFLDLPKMGSAGFALSNVALAAFFAALGVGLVALKNALHRKGFIGNGLVEARD